MDHSWLFFHQVLSVDSKDWNKVQLLCVTNSQNDLFKMNMLGLRSFKLKICIGNYKESVGSAKMFFYSLRCFQKFRGDCKKVSVGSRWCAKNVRNTTSEGLCPSIITKCPLTYTFYLYDYSQYVSTTYRSSQVSYFLPNS